MIFKRSLALLAITAILLLTGCTATPETNTVSTLPEPEVAKAEAKEALRNWQTLLETGQNAEFIKASMPEEVYQMSVTEDGALKEEVVDKLRAFAPRIVNALNEAQFIQPEISGDNVVFTYNDIHSSNGFFKNEKIYLSKGNGRWYFNGQMLQQVAEPQ